MEKYPSTPWCLILRCQDLTRPFEGNLPGTLKPGMGDGVGKISDDARKSLENLRRTSCFFKSSPWSCRLGDEFPHLSDRICDVCIRNKFTKINVPAHHTLGALLHRHGQLDF